MREPAAGALATGDARPPWSALLRAIREARGVTQEGFAARLGYGRRTVRRWESGEAVPDAAAEAAILAYCAEQGLWGRHTSGPLAGFTAEQLRDILTAARVGEMPPANTEPPPAMEWTASAPAGGNLPIPLDSFVGRTDEVAFLTALLRRGEARLVTLTGPRGMGKTRLGLAVADALRPDFRDGADFVSLASIIDPALVLPTLAQALGIRAEGRPVAEALRQALRDRQFLLLLDNLEQVLAAAGAIGDLLATCAGLTVLATSRAPLGLSGEQEFLVPPLAVPDSGRAEPVALICRYDAVALFVARATAVDAGFSVSEETAPLVARICARLDGLPLAIELAAARTRLLDPRALLERLDQRLPILTGGARDAPARHQTLRAAIAWSHDLLTRAEQRLFAWLSVFAGGCTLEAAEAVCAAAGEGDSTLLDGVASLVEQSLFRRVDGPDGTSRVAMLETIREFGQERLLASGAHRAARGAHAAYFLALAEQAEPHLWSGARGPWMVRLRAEQDNLRAALPALTEAGRVDEALRLVGALGWWYFNESPSEGRAAAEALLAEPGTASAGRARALFALGFLLWGPEPERAQDYLRESAGLWQQLGDERRRAYALAYAGMAAREDSPTATAYMQESMALMKATGDHWGLALATHHRGFLATHTQDLPAAQTYLTTSLAMARELEDPWLLGLTLMNLGHAAAHAGDLARAISLYEEMLVLCQATANRVHAAAVVCGIARVAHLRGDTERAARLFGGEAAIRRTIGAPPSPLYRTVYQPVIEAVRATLGEEAFTAVWSTGEAMSLDATIALALDSASSGISDIPAT